MATIQQQVELLKSIIAACPGEPSQWRHLLQVAMWALDHNAAGLHQNIPAIEGGPDEPFYFWFRRTFDFNWIECMKCKRLVTAELAKSAKCPNCGYGGPDGAS